MSVPAPAPRRGAGPGAAAGSRWRTLARRALGLVLAGLVALGLAELALRALGVTYPVFDTYDPERGVALRPGKRGRYEREGGAELSINSLGYRDVEHAPPPAPGTPRGTYRVAVLGDSFTEARQVALADTWWKRLEAGLGACEDLGGRAVEVASFGVGSYGPAQELLTLRRDALAFGPDLVVLAVFTGNDVGESSRRIAEGSGLWREDFRPFFRLEGGELVLDAGFREGGWGHWKRRLLFEGIHRSRVLEVVNQARRLREVRQIRARTAGGARVAPGLYEVVYVPPPDEAWSEAWRIAEAVWARAARESEAAGARFVLVTLSNPVQVHPDAAVRERLQAALGVEDLFHPERRIRAFGAREGVEVVTLAERLQERAFESGEHLHGFANTSPGTGHWNERGHAAAAELLATDLCSWDAPGSSVLSAVLPSVPPSVPEDLPSGRMESGPGGGPARAAPASEAGGSSRKP